MSELISRQAAEERLKKVVDEMALIFSDIREKNVDDSVCGLCEYDCDHGIDGCANECPGFERDDCFKLKEEYRKGWTDLSDIPSVEPEIEKCEDCISRIDMLKKLNSLCNNTCEYSKIQRKSMCDACNLDLVFDMINNAKAVEPDRKTGKWLPHMVTAKCESIDRDVCSECRTCFYGEPTWSWKYCPKCGAPMEVGG